MTTNIPQSQSWIVAMSPRHVVLEMVQNKPLGQSQRIVLGLAVSKAMCVGGSVCTITGILADPSTSPGNSPMETVPYTRLNLFEEVPVN